MTAPRAMAELRNMAFTFSSLFFLGEHVGMQLRACFDWGCNGSSAWECKPASSIMLPPSPCRLSI